MDLINKILETLFPVRKDFVIVGKLNPVNFLQKYQLITEESFVALSSFKDEEIRACVHETKFHDNETATSLLALLLKQYLRSINEPVLLIPIPLFKDREKKRGYNQVERVTRLALKDQPNVTLEKNILIRVKNTVPQTSLAKSERLKNVIDAFAINPGAQARLKNANVVLVDDVATTGATLKAARLALGRHHPAKITCVAISH